MPKCRIGENTSAFPITLGSTVNGALNNMKTLVWDTGAFPIALGLQQDSVLSSYLFVLFVDEPNRHIQNEVT